MGLRESVSAIPRRLGYTGGHEPQTDDVCRQRRRRDQRIDRRTLFSGGIGVPEDRPPDERVFGEVLAVFIITIAAAEVGLALAIVLRLFKNKGSVNTDEMDEMKW